jgi:hypothetical protein
MFANIPLPGDGSVGTFRREEISGDELDQMMYATNMGSAKIGQTRQVVSDRPFGQVVFPLKCALHLQVRSGIGLRPWTKLGLVVADSPWMAYAGSTSIQPHQRVRCGLHTVENQSRSWRPYKETETTASQFFSFML